MGYDLNAPLLLSGCSRRLMGMGFDSADPLSAFLPWGKGPSKACCMVLSAAVAE